MDKELLWSWDSSQPDTENIQLPLSITIEKVISIVALTIMLGIFIIYISPMMGDWSHFVFLLIYLALIPYTLINYKAIKASNEIQHISIFMNEINLNYYGYRGTYPIKNIDLESVRINYIFVSRGGHFGFSKGLCFKTISPAMHVKVPLPLLKPGLSNIEAAIKVLKKRSN